MSPPTVLDKRTTLASTALSAARAAGSAITTFARLALQAVIIGLVIAYVPTLMRDPGQRAAAAAGLHALAFATVVSLMPLLLSALTVGLVSLSFGVPQAKLYFGAGGLASSAGSTPRGPSGQRLHLARSARTHVQLLSSNAAPLLRSRHGLAGVGILASPAVLTRARVRPLLIYC